MNTSLIMMETLNNRKRFNSTISSQLRNEYPYSTVFFQSCKYKHVQLDSTGCVTSFSSFDRFIHQAEQNRLDELFTQKMALDQDESRYKNTCFCLVTYRPSSC